MNQNFLIYGGSQEERVSKIEQILEGFSIKKQHPDLMIVDLKGDIKSIGISQTREISIFLSIKPFSLNLKIVVINNADTLTEEAQNSILKTLEEGSKFGRIFLECNNPKKILPTVFSRCIPIYIKGKKSSSTTNRNLFFKMNMDEKMQWVEDFSKKDKIEILQELDLIIQELSRQDIEKTKKQLKVICEVVENLNQFQLNSKITLTNLVLQLS